MNKSQLQNLYKKSRQEANKYSMAEAAAVNAMRRHANQPGGGPPGQVEPMMDGDAAIDRNPLGFSGLR